MNGLKTNIFKLCAWLTRMSWVKFVFIQLLISLLSVSIGVVLMYSFDCVPVSSDEDDIPMIYLLFLPLSALIETLIFQHLPMIFFKSRLNKDNKKYPLIYIIFSALIFGIFHLVRSEDSVVFEIIRIIDATIVGIVLATSYYILWHKQQHPVISVSIIHLMHNMIILGLACVL
ncbi:MAG: CPBP family glutamic-type intramembrane protease [Bacteroidales bacterium]|nr:CPBP family glutamic-type intramembrane protease [Bacteroidales bacterium]